MRIRSSCALLILLGCAHPVESALRSPRETVEIVYEERGELLGAEQIRVAPDGGIERRRWRPDFATASDHPEAYLHADEPLPPDGAGADVVEVGNITASEQASLEALLLDLEAWEQRVDEDVVPIEASRAVLTLRAPDGRSQVWEWVNDLQAQERLVRVKMRLQELADAHAR